MQIVRRKPRIREKIGSLKKLLKGNTGYSYQAILVYITLALLWLSAKSTVDQEEALEAMRKLDVVLFEQKPAKVQTWFRRAFRHKKMGTPKSPQVIEIVGAGGRNRTDTSPRDTGF